jgi:hypothetical protein
MMMMMRIMMMMMMMMASSSSSSSSSSCFIWCAMRNGIRDSVFTPPLAKIGAKTPEDTAHGII